MKRYIKPIYCMSISRIDLTRRLYQISGDLLEHLALYYISDSDETCHHWTSEIYAFLHSIPILKGNNRFPNADMIYNNTFRIWQDSLAAKLPSICKEHDMKFNPNVIHSLMEFADRYFIWLCNQLSTIGRVSALQVYDILRDIKSESLLWYAPYIPYIDVTRVTLDTADWCNGST